MKQESKVYEVVAVSSETDTPIKEIVKAVNPDRAMAEVQNYHRRVWRDADFSKISYTVAERIIPYKDENQKRVFKDLDHYVDRALESVESLLRDMEYLRDKLKFQREKSSYNPFGEIQSKGSSVEIEIGKVCALQEILQRLDYSE